MPRKVRRVDRCQASRSEPGILQQKRRDSTAYAKRSFRHRGPIEGTGEVGGSSRIWRCAWLCSRRYDRLGGEAGDAGAVVGGGVGGAGAVAGGNRAAADVMGFFFV